MYEKRDFTAEELLEHFKNNNIKLSYEVVKEIADSGKEKSIDDVLSDENNPISQYESLTDKMKEKIKKIIESIKEPDDRDEKDTLDEKDGKEELDEDKKEQVDKRKRENGEDKEVEDKEEKTEETKEKGDDKKENKKEETPKKDEYLAKLEKLHKMKIVDLKYQMKTGEADVDRYYMSMIVLQRSLNRQRAAYIKAYGAEELVRLENEYLNEENKYQRTITNNMEVALAKLRALDEKLDAIFDEMLVIQQSLEDESISIDEYNDRIDALEEDKLDTLWQINKLNPELLEEIQDNQKIRGKIERKITPAFLAREKRKDMSSLNKARTSGIEYDKNKQEGKAEKSNIDRTTELELAIKEKEKRMDEIMKEIKGLDMKNPDDRKRVGLLTEELYSLNSSRLELEEQKESLEKNMKAGVQDYGDLKEPETKRKDDVKEFSEDSKKIDFTNQTPEFMDQYVNDVVELSDSDDAKELLENMEKIAEEAREEQEKKKDEPEESKEKTLFGNKYGSNN